MIGIFTMLTIMTSMIPIPVLLINLKTASLIDRPFLSIFLFIPFSVILGLNFASLERYIHNRFGMIILRKILIVLLFAFIFFPNKKVSEPLPDVNFVTVNDLFLYQEIIKRIPPGSKILIPNHAPYYELGLDGGTWISFATGRTTIKLNYEEDLTSYLTFKFICKSGVEYIYSGNKPSSFSSEKLEQRQPWYNPVIYYPDVRLYQVINCPN
jgi:hypothetical protein